MIALAAMVRSSSPTTQAGRYDVVLVVAGTPEVMRAVDYAAGITVNARVEPCTIENASTVAAKYLPFAIVVMESTYAFDPSEFGALAQDVSAVVIRLPDGLKTEDAIVARVSPQLRHAMRQRQGPTSRRPPSSGKP